MLWRSLECTCNIYTLNHTLTSSFNIILYRICRLRTILSVFDDDIKTTWLFGIHCRSDLHAPAHSWTVDQTHHRSDHWQVQMSPVHVYRQLDSHTRVRLSTIINTRDGLQRRNRRYGRSQVAVVLVVLRHDRFDKRWRNGQKCPGGHDLHGPVG